MRTTAYNYKEAVKNDVVDYIKESINLSNYNSPEALENALNDELWTADGVTGNGSGSYTFSSAEARGYVLANMDLLREALDCFGDREEGANRILNEEWEALDVTIRCYLLGGAISEALKNIELNGEAINSLDELIDAVREELEDGNTILYACIGNGGNGLNILTTQDPDDIARFIGELKGLYFNGRVKSGDICPDIAECNLYSLYNQDSSVYQLSDASGLIYQIVL